MYIDQFYTDTLFCENGFRFNSLPYHVAASENGNVFSIQHFISLTNGKRSVAGKDRPAWTTKAQVSRTMMIAQSNSRCLGLIMVSRYDNGHAWKHLHHTNIFQYLVRRAIFAQGEARVRCTDLYILIGV